MLIWVSTQFVSIWPIDMTLSSATTSGQSGPVSDGNEGVLHIPHSSSITGTSPLDCLVSYPVHSLRPGSYPSAEMQLVYSIAPADWAKKVKWFQVLLYSSYILISVIYFGSFK